MRLRIPNRVAMCVWAGLAVVVSCSAAGCYKHVVGAEGIGADRYDIYEPNLKNPDDSALPKRQTVPTKTIPSKQTQ